MAEEQQLSDEAAIEQEDDLDAKKRILAKMDREKKWNEDESWKAQDARNRAMPRSKDAPPGFEEKKADASQKVETFIFKGYLLISQWSYKIVKNTIDFD